VEHTRGTISAARPAVAHHENELSPNRLHDSPHRTRADPLLAIVTEDADPIYISKSARTLRVL
jgi:hypothetical protein